MSVTEFPVVAVAYENAGPALTSAAPTIAVQTINRMRVISILSLVALPGREGFSAVCGAASTRGSPERLEIIAFGESWRSFLADTSRGGPTHEDTCRRRGAGRPLRPARPARSRR